MERIYHKRSPSQTYCRRQGFWFSPWVMTTSDRYILTAASSFSDNTRPRRPLSPSLSSEPKRTEPHNMQMLNLRLVLLPFGAATLKLVSSRHLVYKNSIAISCFSHSSLSTQSALTRARGFSSAVGHFEAPRLHRSLTWVSFSFVLCLKVRDRNAKLINLHVSSNRDNFFLVVCIIYKVRAFCSVSGNHSFDG
jgi:hypothetical protein